MPPVYGLYASIVPSLVYTFFGTSREMAFGPVAIVSLLLNTTISLIAVPGDVNDYVQKAWLLSFLIGAASVLLGVFRAGFVANFLSLPVLSSFLSVSGFIIFIEQLKLIFGTSPPRSDRPYIILYNFFDSIDKTNRYAFLLPPPTPT